MVVGGGIVTTGSLLLSGGAGGVAVGAAVVSGSGTDAAAVSAAVVVVGAEARVASVRGVAPAVGGGGAAGGWAAPACVPPTWMVVSVGPSATAFGGTRSPSAPVNAAIPMLIPVAAATPASRPTSRCGRVGRREAPGTNLLVGSSSVGVRACGGSHRRGATTMVCVPRCVPLVTGTTMKVLSQSLGSGRMERRDFLKLAGVAAVAVRFPSLAGGAASGGGAGGPYGELLPADANGIMLPEGFTSIEVARSSEVVGSSGYVWHRFPDGGATFPVKGDGWIYTSNCEVPNPGEGGAGALRFDRGGEMVDAYPILEGTQTNCAGGPTPWATWLSCEEHAGGQVWECDPTGRKPAVVQPALGVFKHEAAAVDPKREHVYLTEDEPDGRLYRFTPEQYPKLDAGTLEVAAVDDDDEVTWHELSDPSATGTPTRQQVPESAAFNGGEGIWYEAGVVYFATKGDQKVWAYDAKRARLTTLHDPAESPGSPISSVDNLVMTPGGDLLVAEDQTADQELVLITPEAAVVPLLRMDASHEGSELCGPAFSPDGRQLYFSSERGGGGPGVTYAVTGPFEQAKKKGKKKRG